MKLHFNSSLILKFKYFIDFQILNNHNKNVKIYDATTFRI